MKFIRLYVVAIALLVSGCSKKTETPAFNDPIAAQIHTLENGLKVYLSVNKESPRIQTFVAVNTGSTNDPADATGLAHYLEHMLFKGTSKISSMDWEKEKVLLDHLSELYEHHRSTTDSVAKKAIYAKIDSVSFLAASYAIPNEYDRMVKGMGAQGTNAYTSVERTVYINDIPATELEKWMVLEAERFSELTLRLFHTELETVYEEFNRGQDNDYRLSYTAMNELLFPNHPYGTQTTLGKGEHLKNPSLVKIHEYFNKYYVPNNMAICLAGDFDPDEALAMIKKHFGGWKSKPEEQPKHPKEGPLTKVQEKTVFGPMKEWVNIGFRFDGYGSRDALLVKLLAQVLFNGTAGLIDLDLLQRQRILEGYAYEDAMRDHSILVLNGSPKSGQTLEEVRALLLEQVERVKTGDFPDELLPAIIRNLKLQELEQYQYNWLRASTMSDAFIMGADWQRHMTITDTLATITKADLMEWTKAKLADNYVVVYKRTGKNPDTFRIEKPKITPIDINREGRSAFYAKLDSMESLRLKPEFLDFKTAISVEDLRPSVPFYHVQNSSNELFSLFIELDEELKTDPKVKLALRYLNYLGTDSISNTELKQKLYELGLQFATESSSWKVYVALSGLQESFPEGLKLMEHVLAKAKPDSAALVNLIQDELKQREDNAKNKWMIMQGLTDRAKFGAKNKFNNQLTRQELEAVTAEELVAIARSMTSYGHRVFYYGPSPKHETMALLKDKHRLPAELRKVQDPKKFPEQPTEREQVFFANYDMVQTELTMLSKLGPYQKDNAGINNLFNQYYGSGLSSVVFQEVRESRALAYSAYAFVSTPAKKDESHYIQAYVGAQNDKLKEAVTIMHGLMDAIPAGTEPQFEESRIAAMKSMESNRVVRESIYWYYRSLEDRGLDYDQRKDIYADLGRLKHSDIVNYFNKEISGRKYIHCVIGKKEEMDMKFLKGLGEYRELSLQEVFGY
jgi:zinc protease